MVYQNISNYGNATDVDLSRLLDSFVQSKLVDEVFLYEPDLAKNGGWNERNKRNIGLNLIRKNGCSHFMTMDTDEFYKQDEFLMAKQFILDKDITETAVPIYMYVQSPRFRIVEPSYGFVPFICKINPHTKLGGKNAIDFPVLVDPTRLTNDIKRFWCFPRNEIAMHHMNYVRKDLHKKYKNSSFNDSIMGYEQKIRRIQDIENFEIGQCFEGMEVIEVDDIFCIEKEDEVAHV